MQDIINSDVCKESVFAKLYELHAQNLHDFLYYKYGNNLNPGDKAQDAFAKMWENCKDVTPDKAKSYVFTIGNNMMLNEVKHQKVVLNYKNAPSKSYTNENPEFLLEKEEYYKKYQQVLSSLTEEQRTAFLLSKVEGKKHEEIAEILGVTRKVVEYRIYSAFGKLKEELQNFRVK